MPINVSIIVPVKDEKDPYLTQCMESLEGQNYSEAFEVIVIKGGNRAQARNLGIAKAQGRIIAFIDADCIAPKNWLLLLTESLSKGTSIGGVGGTNFSPNDGSYLGKAIDLLFSSFIGSLGSASLSTTSRPKYVSALACINSAFNRKTLQAIGGFDEEYELCEDTNLSYKVRDTGCKLLFVDNIFVWHYRRDTIKRFAKQFFLYGLGRMRSMLTDKRYLSKGATILFLATLFFPLLVWLSPLLAVTLLVLYISAIISVGIKGAIKKNRVSLLGTIPLLLMVEHFSYFFGMVCGVIKGKWEKPKEKPEVLYHKVFRKIPLEDNLIFKANLQFDSEMVTQSNPPNY